MRRLGISAILLLPLLLLVGCTPADQPVVALAVRDGQPVGVLVTCAGSTSGVGVYRDDRSSSAAAADRLITWSVTGSAHTDVVEVPLLGTPPPGFAVSPATDHPGIEAGSVVDVQPLTEVRSGLRYTLTGFGREDAIPVDFSPADYARLGPDQVLVPGDDGARVVSRSDFLSRARDEVGCR